MQHATCQLDLRKIEDTATDHGIGRGVERRGRIGAAVVGQARIDDGLRSITTTGGE